MPLRGASRVLFTQKEVVGRTQMILWAARSGFLQKNRAAMVDFMEDSIRAARWLLDPKNHAGAVQIAAKVSKRPAAGFDKWLFMMNGQSGDYYRDPDMKMARGMGVLGLPVSVLIDADGREVARLTGDADWATPEAKAVIERLLE